MTCQSELPGLDPLRFSLEKLRVPVLILATWYSRELNSLIMDYMISEGYPLAAQKFSLEANIQPRVDIESIQERVEIRNAIYGGDIQTAIEKINELSPQVSSYIAVHIAVSFRSSLAMIISVSCTTHIPLGC